MKKLVLLMMFFGMTPLAIGEVSTRVCMADGNTPLEYRDIMVGTRLTIIVDSNTAKPWEGSLALMGEDVNRAELFAREPLEAAGPEAFVSVWPNYGFDLYTDLIGVQVGTWFIIDYYAIDIGDCNLAFFDGIDYEPPYDPTYYIEFTHVRTRDFDGSTTVDFGDFAILGSYWQERECEGPDWCEGTDLDTSGAVDINDLMLFTDYWLEKTE